MSAAVSVDWGAIATLAGILLALLGGLIRLVRIAERIQEAVKSHHESIDRNARHLDSLMEAQWQTIMRVATAEDFLSDKMAYRPPRLIPFTGRADNDPGA